MEQDWPMWRLFRLRGADMGVHYFTLSHCVCVFEKSYDKKLKDRQKGKNMSVSDPLFPLFTLLLHNYQQGS